MHWTFPPSFNSSSSCSPFFLYFAPDNTHIPLFTSPQFQGVSRRGLYGDCVEELDFGVGRILDTIRHLGIRKSTCEQLNHKILTLKLA